MIRLCAAVLVSLVALAGCGGADEPTEKPAAKPSVDLPTGNVNVPPGITLTKAGTKLAFGKTATVAYEPNADRGSVLELTVKSARQGTIADLSGYVLDERTSASTPYYVQVAVKNVGDGDVGQTPIPLWAVDATNTLIQASSFTNSFAPCPSTPLPATFPPNATVDTCLVYLAPDHGTLTAVSFRPLQAFEPIVWTGDVTPPGDKGKGGKGKKSGKGKSWTELRIGALRVATPVVLAPMAGITNAAYRRLCREQGAGLYVCEMITSRGLVEDDATTKSMLVFDDLEDVRSVQLYGTDPRYVGQATEILCAEYAVAHVDLNFGCPVPKVTRKGGGAALPWKRNLLGEILRAAVRAAEPYGVPVTMKTRLGIDEEHLTYLDAGRIAEESGAAAIALHGRTAIQGYSGAAAWEPIGELAGHVGIPVLGNGDIWEAADALRMVELTGAAGVVVGRGCLGRPWLFRDLAAAFAGEEVAVLPTLGEVRAMMRRHAELLSQHMGEERGCKEFRKHVSWYLKGFPAGGDLRHALALISSLAELDGLLDRLDPGAPYPVSELGAPRGRQGAPRKRVVLPEGWLDDTDGRGLVVPEAVDEISGG